MRELTEGKVTAFARTDINDVQGICMTRSQFSSINKNLILPQCTLIDLSFNGFSDVNDIWYNNTTTTAAITSTSSTTISATTTSTSTTIISTTTTTATTTSTSTTFISSTSTTTTNIATIVLFLMRLL